MREQETIIHNTGDEPILVEQADGSQMIVRPGEKRQARLVSRGDFANAAAPIRSANPTRVQRRELPDLPAGPAEACHDFPGGARSTTRTSPFMPSIM